MHTYNGHIERTLVKVVRLVNTRTRDGCYSHRKLCIITGCGADRTYGLVYIVVARCSEVDSSGCVALILRGSDLII